MTKIKAALFDMDGLLVDTETLGIQVAAQIFEKRGIKLNQKERQSFIGTTDEEFYERIIRGRKLDLRAKDLLEEHNQVYDELLKSKLHIFPGAIESVRTLKPHYKLALVSGSNAKQTGIVLKSLGLSGHFDVVVSCEDIEHGKPSPEPYSLAARKLGIQPNECVVIEDSRNGVISAKRAGMKCIAVDRPKQRQDLSEADRVIRTLNALKAELLLGVMGRPIKPKRKRKVKPKRLPRRRR